MNNTLLKFEKTLQEKSVIELENLYKKTVSNKKKNLIQSYIDKQLKEIEVDIDDWINCPLVKLALTRMYWNKINRLRKKLSSPVKNKPEASRKIIHGKEYYVADNCLDLLNTIIEIREKVFKQSTKAPEILISYTQYLKDGIKKHDSNRNN